MMNIDSKPLVFLFFLQQTLAGEGELVGDLLHDQLDHHDPKTTPGSIVVMWSKVISKSFTSCLSQLHLQTQRHDNTLINKQIYSKTNRYLTATTRKTLGEGGGGGEEQGDCHGQDGEQHLVRKS